MGRDKGSRRRRAARWLSGSSLTPRPGGPLTEDTAGSEAEALRVPYERHGAWGATGAQGEADSEWGTQEAPRRPPTGREVDTEPAGGQQRAPHGGLCAEGGGSVRTRRPARASLPHVRGRAAARGPGPPDASPAASGPSTLTRRRSQRKDTRSFSLKSTFKRNKTRVLPRNVPSFVGNKNKEKEKHSHDCSKRAEPGGRGAARVTWPQLGVPAAPAPPCPHGHRVPSRALGPAETRLCGRAVVTQSCLAPSPASPAQ